MWYRAPDVLLSSRKYSTAIDIWSVGCIFAEMVLGNVLFQGSNLMDQITIIFQALGTPNEEIWPTLHELPDWDSSLPVFPAKPLSDLVPGLDEAGYDLLKVSFWWTN
jgi:cyclin-dependent kinase